jgi:hypothetical protein
MTDSNLRDLCKCNTEGKGLKGELQEDLDSGSEVSKTAPQGFPIKTEANTIENMNQEAITKETENVLSFAMDHMTGKWMIGCCRVCCQQGTYLAKCCGPENVSEQILRLEETQEQLMGKKRYTDNSNYPLAPGLPEFGICETCSKHGRK